MNSDVKIIHTGIYGKTARVGLIALWERVLSCHECKKSTFKNTSICSTKLEVADDNELVFVLERFWHHGNRIYPFNDFKTDARTLDHLVWVMKCYVKDNYKDEPDFEWSRSSTFDLGKDLTVADLYLVYDKLRGREKKVEAYPEAQRNNVIGLPLDPIATEMHIAQKEQIAEIYRMADLKCQDLNKECRVKKNEKYKEYESFCKETDDLYRKLQDQVLAKAKEDAEKLANEMDSIISNAAETAA